VEYAITGLGPVFVRTAHFDYFKEMMEKVLLFEEIDQDGSFHLFETGEGGNGAQVVVEYNAVLPNARQGYGTIHHAAFRVNRSEEHTSELQSRFDLVCRILLE